MYRCQTFRPDDQHTEGRLIILELVILNCFSISCYCLAFSRPSAVCIAMYAYSGLFVALSHVQSIVNINAFICNLLVLFWIYVYTQSS